MKLVPIGGVTERVGTWNPTREPHTKFTYVDLSAVDNVEKQVTAPTAVRGGEAPSRARQLIKAQDVLVSTVRPNLNAVALVGPELDGATASTGFTVLRPADGIDAKYLFHWVRTPQFVSDMVRKATGASYPAVSDRIVKDSLIPLPTLGEQRRIAAILDQADTLRHKRRKVLRTVDTLSSALFVEMFGDPVTNDRSWPTRTFGEVCETRLGKMLDAKQQTGRDQRPYLRNANVQWFRFDMDEIFSMDIDARSRAILRLEPGDVLICEGGQPGRAAIWTGEIEEMYFQKALHRARPNRELATPEFIAHLMYALVTRNGLKDHVTSATIGHLTGEKLKRLPIIVPDIRLQNRFSHRVGAIDKERATQQRAASLVDSLFASLQTRAFAGQLIAAG